MSRLVRPLAYILGYSVFCACTTTRGVDLSQIEPGAEMDRLVWVIMKEDGSRVLLRDTYRTEVNLIGFDERCRSCWHDPNLTYGDWKPRQLAGLSSFRDPPTVPTPAIPYRFVLTFVGFVGGEAGSLPWKE